MKHERYKKLKKLPKNTPAGKMLKISEYAKKRGVTPGAIYLTIDRVKDGSLSWNEYECFQHKKEIYVLEKS